jgi:single-strand DNA-binding protein
VASLGLAVTPRRRDASGGFVDGETTYLDDTVWGPQAQHAAQTLLKGARVVVLGRLATRVYTPQVGADAGREVRKLEVVVDEIGPSLRWATATLSAAPESSTSSKPATPPF